MAVSVSGLGSNLDIAGIVKQLMDVERQPLKVLDKKEASFQSQISAFGSIKSALSSLQVAVAGMKLPPNMNALDFYSSYKGSVTDDKIATITAGEGAVPGNYSLEVNQLATQHRLASTPGMTIGKGTLAIQLGSEDGSSTNRTTSINITDSSLTSIRDAINGANAGVSAAVVNGTGGARLVLTSNDGGDDQFIRLSGISGLEFPPPDSDAPTFTEQQKAQSAQVSLNGIPIESKSNKITDALQGVTIELKQTTEADKPTSLTITRDTSSLNNSMDKMVTAFNEFNKLVKELSGFDASTRKLGTLGGDATVRSADAMLRQALAVVSPELSGVGMRTLSDIGVSIQRDGTMKLDTAKLEKAIASDFAGVARVAAGVAFSVDKMITGLNGPTGTLTNKTEGIRTSVKSLELQRTEMERRFTIIEARYKKQYTALDSLVSGMLQTSNYLQQQLANLPSASK